jgi:hypothetical protein
MTAEYDPTSWAAETSLGRRVFNFNFRLSGDEMRGWELVNLTDADLESGAREHIYVYRQSKAPQEVLLRVDIIELDNWRSAQQRLHTTLLHCMRPEIPRAKGRLSRTGDICYMGDQADAGLATSAFFTRGNLFVSVTSVGDVLADVVSLAKKLDSMLSEVPKDTGSSRASAGKLSPDVQLKDVKEGEPVAVIDSLADVAADGGWIKVIAPDGELRRDEDRLVYLPEKGGKKKVGRYVLLPGDR